MVGAIELTHLESQIERSAGLVVGDSQMRVFATLGQPDFRWKHRKTLHAWMYGNRPRQWIYGTTIDIRSIVASGELIPNPIPIKLRLFSPDDGDLVVSFDRDGKIASIQRPDLIK